MTTFPSECVGKRRAERASDGRRISSGRRKTSADVDVEYRRISSISSGHRRRISSEFERRRRPVGFRRKSSAPSTSNIVGYRRMGRRKTSEIVGFVDVEYHRKLSALSTSNIIGICRNTDVENYRNVSEHRRLISSEFV